MFAGNRFLPTVTCPYMGFPFRCSPSPMIWLWGCRRRMGSQSLPCARQKLLAISWFLIAPHRSDPALGTVLALFEPVVQIDAGPDTGPSFPAWCGSPLGRSHGRLPPSGRKPLVVSAEWKKAFANSLSRYSLNLASIKAGLRQWHDTNRSSCLGS